jgi:DNA-binding NarL/FixJ family response regulator
MSRRLAAETCFLTNSLLFTQEEHNLSSVRILVADDYKDWRRQICSLLHARPELQVICEVADGLEAVTKAQEFKPDLILLDIGFPTLNGIEAARRIRRLSPSSKIIFVSLNNSPAVVEEALSLGAWGYVLKSEVRSELLTAIEAVLRGRQFVSSSLGGKKFSERTDAQTPYRHEIVFCSDDTVLLDSFTCAVVTALNTGNAAIVLATRSHRESLCQRLNKHGLDVGQAVQKGTYIALDVAEALSAIMVSGLPDPVRFFGGIGEFIETATKAANADQPRVVVCGEGVATLRAEGKADAAIRLEQLCDELVKTHEVDVLCAYPTSSFQSV